MMIAQQLERVHESIVQTAQAAGRDPDGIRLVVVTKGHPVEAVQAVLAAGARHLGENYVEEGVQKLLACTTPGITWHMIGHIQSRKARLVGQHFDYVHALDSVRLAQRLDKAAGGAGRRLPVLLECNVSGEESKFGLPAWDESSWQSLLPDLDSLLALPALEVRGLMTMAPFFDQPEPARPYFRRLRQLRDFLAQRLPQTNWSELSMGMSGDYHVAIQEGATLVRIGTAIMGQRPARPVSESEAR